MTDYSKLNEIGVWLDDAFSKVNSDYIALLKKANINSVSIMANKSNTKPEDKLWELRYKKEDFQKLSKTLNDAGIKVGLTCWPQPSKTQIDLMMKDMIILLDMTGASSFMVDTESNWHQKFLKPEEFSTMQLAADYLVEKMKDAGVKHKVKLELTTFPYHVENSKDALVAPHMDVLFPQAYSVANRDNGEITWDDKFGPGNMQKLSIERAKKVKNFKGEYAIGLAAYDQIFKGGHTGQESIKKALDKSIDLGATKVFFWSSKWIVGSSKTNYGIDFLSKLK